MTDSSENRLRVALVQETCDSAPAHNLKRQAERIHEAASKGAQLVLLQELHNSRYFCQQEDPAHFDLAEPIPGPSTEHFGALAKTLGIVIVASLFERRAPGLYHNTAVVLDTDGSLAGRYRKMHIPDDPGYYEKFYFTPGDLGFTPIQTSVGSLGVLVCWDQWYPEAARLMTLAGADLLLYPTAIGWDPRDNKAEHTRQQQAWELIQRSHAIANGIPVLACNRVGYEPDPQSGQGIQFWGHSFVCGPQGEILAMADDASAQLVLTDIDRQHTEQVRRMWPYLRDRRIDAYGDLQRRYRD
jgi:N-carbamoylputrescine amidase